jgi:hypothetical protein
VPLSVFDGEPTIHEHYDPDGNLTGSTVIPGWSDMDRAWALGLALREASQCPNGHDLAESLDYEFMWIPELPLVCLQCVSLENAIKAHEKDPRRRAMIHRLKKVHRPKPKKRRG